MSSTHTVEIGTEVPPNATIVLEPHGFVNLVECHANDLMVVNTARVSFRKMSHWDLGDAQAEFDQLLEFIKQNGGFEVADQFFRENAKLHEIDEKVLRFLMKDKHGTPFEHNFFTFHIRAPIFVFREWHRHRIGISINEESGRYVQLQPDFYIPDMEHCRVQHGKPGHYTFEPIEDADLFDRITYRYKLAYRAAYEHYEFLLNECGLAKELARAVLPVGIYSQMYWSCNARSLMAFLTLRNAPKALREIRDYAAVMEQMFVEKMPVTAAAFVEGGRVAP